LPFNRSLTAIGTLLLSVAAPAQTRPGHSQLPDWSLSTAPLLSLGGDGTPATEFLRIRQVFRLPAGLIAVVNGGGSGIRIFDLQGLPISTFGRTGSGPGEFRSMGWSGRSGDTAFVYDPGLRRISIILLGRESRLLKSLGIVARGTRGQFFVAGRLEDGRWLVLTAGTFSWEGPPGVHRIPGSAGVMNAEATGDVTWLAELPSLAVVVHNPTGDIRKAQVGPIAFSPAFHAVVSGAYVWFGESGSDSLVRYDSRDGKRGTLQLPFSRAAPSGALVAATRNRELAVARDARSRAWTDAKLSSAYLPSTLPFFESVVPGPRGELWIQGYSGIRTAESRYLVVGSDLRPRAWVHVPRGFRVQEVGLEYVVGVHEDEDGVESVRLYGLSRR